MSDSEDEGSVYSDAGSGRNEGGSDVSMNSKIKSIISVIIYTHKDFCVDFKYTTHRDILI